jgi:hypothetical protein
MRDNDDEVGMFRTSIFPLVKNLASCPADMLVRYWDVVGVPDPQWYRQSAREQGVSGGSGQAAHVSVGN